MEQRHVVHDLMGIGESKPAADNQTVSCGEMPAGAEDLVHLLLIYMSTVLHGIKFSPQMWHILP